MLSNFPIKVELDELTKRQRLRLGWVGRVFDFSSESWENEIVWPQLLDKAQLHQHKSPQYHQARHTGPTDCPCGQMIMLVTAESLAGSCMTYTVIAFILHSEACGIRYYRMVGGTWPNSFEHGGPHTRWRIGR
jgi:hypothetical protein